MTAHEGARPLGRCCDEHGRAGPPDRCPKCGRRAEVYVGGAECSSPDMCGWSGEQGDLENAVQARDVAALLGRLDEIDAATPGHRSTTLTTADIRALLGTGTAAAGA